MKKNKINMILDALIFVIVIYIPLFLVIVIPAKEGDTFDCGPDSEWFTYKNEVDENDKNKSVVNEESNVDYWNSTEWNYFDSEYK